jgi:hypothetical protein
VKALSDAIWTHKLVVVKGQKDLAPIKQWELVTRFDPNAELIHSHGDLTTFNKQSGLLSVRTSLNLWVYADSSYRKAATSSAYQAQRTSA